MLLFGMASSEPSEHTPVLGDRLVQTWALVFYFNMYSAKIMLKDIGNSLQVQGSRPALCTPPSCPK